ncbi:MAG: GDCCVxC domain-containing (seleno)protein, partial [Methyloceanibacter sp.]
PKCGYQATEIMPTDACVAFYDCNGCGETLRPLPGSCYVFCSYGSVPCPPIQEGVEPCCTPQLDQSFGKRQRRTATKERVNEG